MGLFIGASLLTILEILDYLCEVGQNPRHNGEGTGHKCPGRWMLATYSCHLSPGFPRQSPGVFLEQKELSEALWQHSGNSPLAFPYPIIVGLTQTLNIWSRSYVQPSCWSPSDSPFAHSFRKG